MLHKGKHSSDSYILYGGCRSLPTYLIVLDKSLENRSVCRVQLLASTPKRVRKIRDTRRLLPFVSYCCTLFSNALFEPDRLYFLLHAGMKFNAVFRHTCPRGYDELLSVCVRDMREISKDTDDCDMFVHSPFSKATRILLLMFRPSLFAVVLLFCTIHPYHYLCL